MGDHGSWAIAMTVREPQVLVLANVVFHLEAGATEIWVYLDDPDDPVGALLEDMLGVRVTRCDDAWWRTHGGRPALQTGRQRINAQHAYESTRAKWLVHLDADEFLWQSWPLSDELRHLRGIEGYLRLTVYERAYDLSAPADGIFDGVLRRALGRGPAVSQAVWGDLLDLSTEGLLAHNLGKPCVPTGQPWRVGVHRVDPEKGGDKLPLSPLIGTTLVHYDGLTPQHWLQKMTQYGAHDSAALARLVGAKRRAQIEAVLACNGDAAALRAVHDRLRGFTPERLSALRDLGYVARASFSPAEVVAPLLPELDFSVAGFDAALAR